MESQTKCIYCKNVLTFKEASEYTGFTEAYLHKLTANQLVPFSKPNGKTIFFSREKLDEWLLGNPSEPKNAQNPRACVRDILSQVNNDNITRDNIRVIERDKEILSDESKERAKKSPTFQIPTQEEVISYFRNELNSTPSLAEDYYDYYASCGWKVGNNKSMKDWKSAARRWVRNQSGYATKKTYQKGPDVTISEHFDPAGDAFSV